VSTAKAHKKKRVYYNDAFKLLAIRACSELYEKGFVLYRDKLITEVAVLANLIAMNKGTLYTWMSSEKKLRAEAEKINASGAPSAIEQLMRSQDDLLAKESKTEPEAVMLDMFSTVQPKPVVLDKNIDVVNYCPDCGINVKGVVSAAAQFFNEQLEPKFCICCGANIKALGIAISAYKQTEKDYV
jgi:hypothetical protein